MHEKLKHPKRATSDSAPPALQRAAIAPAPDAAPPIVHDVLRSPGQPLDTETRAAMEPRFGQDLGDVRVHADAQAAESADAVQARAYTVGNHVAFGAGEYQLGSSAGQRLLAHELAHVVQQSGQQPAPQAKLAIGSIDTPAEQEADRAASEVASESLLSTQTVDSGLVVARAPAAKAKAPSIGSKFTHPSGVKSTFKNVHAEFDGQDFIVFDGTTEIMRQAGQSGKPVSVRAADAKACGGSTADSYANNPLYVGIQDFGPIPEGDFTLSLSEFSTFSATEQLMMISGGMFTDPFGSSLHGGDWGSGRAPLHPKKLLPAPKPGCGDTSRRSGFFLHGGSLPGSSGCIDIDNSGIDSFLKLLAGYTAVIPVKVRYLHPAPSVGSITRGVGRFTYPTKEGKPIKDPTIWDRFKAITGDDDAPTEQPKPAPKPAPKQQTKPTPKQHTKPKPTSKPGQTGSKRSELLPPSTGEKLADDILDDMPDSWLDEDEDEALA